MATAPRRLALANQQRELPLAKASGAVGCEGCGSALVLDGDPCGRDQGWTQKQTERFEDARDILETLGACRRKAPTRPDSGGLLSRTGSINRIYLTGR